MAAKKRTARKRAHPTRVKGKASRRPASKSAAKARSAAPAEDVVYTDVRREMRSGLLARLL